MAPFATFSAVQRLRQTWSLLPERHTKKLYKLEQVMQPQQNFWKYRCGRVDRPSPTYHSLLTNPINIESASTRFRDPEYLILPSRCGTSPSSTLATPTMTRAGPSILSDCSCSTNRSKTFESCRYVQEWGHLFFFCLKPDLLVR